ncbi:MAG: hypothetical protein LBO74_01450 [Candidatus Symbiothrix sp.]|jgi:hypothetical protein|nr:hypothetical protein [Candidatus Symbiothrix sp.]
MKAKTYPIIIAAILSITAAGVLQTACAAAAGEEQPFAYLTIAQELIPYEYIESAESHDPGASDESGEADEPDPPRCFIIDLSGAKIENKDAVYDLIAAHVSVVGAEVLRGDDLAPDEIKNLNTEDSYPTLLAFQDEKLTKNKLVTDLSISWPSQGEGYGTKYTVEKKSDTWEITASEGTWIS